MKPSFDELNDYISREGYSVDPQSFFDYYEERGWTSGGKIIQNWRALVDTWQLSGEGKHKTAEQNAKDERRRRRNAYRIFEHEAYLDACTAYSVFDESAMLKIPQEFLDAYVIAKFRGEKSFIWNNREVKVSYEPKQ